MARHLPRPAARERQQQCAGRAGGEQQPEHLRAAVAGGDGREQRDRHREQHRVDVDEVAAHQVLAAARVAPALRDPRDARRRRVGRRRHRAHPCQRDERDEERRRVDRVGRAQAGARDQDAAERRPGDLAGVAAEALERGRRGQLLARHQARHHRVERGPLQPAGRRHPGRDEEQDPDLRLGEQRVGDQRESEREQRGVGDQHEPAAVVRVGQRAAEQRRDQQRGQLREPEQPDDERRASQVVDLERDRDEGDHRARERDGLARVEQPELAVPAQRPDVERDRAEQAEQRGQLSSTRRPRPARRPESWPDRIGSRHPAPGRAGVSRPRRAPAHARAG